MCSKKLMALAILLSVPSATLYASYLDGETLLLSPSRPPLSPRFKSSAHLSAFAVTTPKLEKLHDTPWSMSATSSPSKRMRMDVLARLPSTPTKTSPFTPSRLRNEPLSQGSESDYGSLSSQPFSCLEELDPFEIETLDKENDKSALNTPYKEKKSPTAKKSALTDDSSPLPRPNFDSFDAFVASNPELFDDEDEDDLSGSAQLVSSDLESSDTASEQSDSDEDFSLDDSCEDDEDSYPLIASKYASEKLEKPAAYYAPTLAAREGFSRSEYKHLRDEGIVMRTPPKPKKKPHEHKKVATKAFAPKYISPTKTSTYTRSQAKAYFEARQESAKSVADWRQEFLDSINVICKALRTKKEADERPNASSFNTLFLKHFSEAAPDFFNQVYVQDTHVFFWNDRMIDLDLIDPETEETNREKLVKGKNFIMFQSPKDKASIEEDDNGDFKLTGEGNIEPRVSNWLHLTQGKEGKTTYKPSDRHVDSPVGQFASQYSGKNVNIVFAGPEDIHCALHELMNRFKKPHEPSVHTIPQGYAKERPLANKEILKRLTQ